VPFSLIAAPSLLRSLFVLTPREILLVSWLATLASWVVEITIEVILRYAPLRFQVEPFPVAPWIRHRRVALFSLLAWPMIGTAVALSSPPWGTGLSMALAGIALAVLSLLAAAVIRELLRDPDEPSPSLLLPMKPRWLDRLPALRSAKKPLPVAPVGTVLAHGYVDPATDRFRPGHLMGASFFAITAFLYALGFFLLRPDRGSMPALGYGLLILMLAGWALPGISFFLDRYRVPVLLPLFAFSWLSSQVFDIDHYYKLLVPQVRTAPGRAGVAAQALPSVSSGEAFRVAQEKNPEPGHPVVVVATTGGGITAALWTAKVLTSLQRQIGPGFSRSIRLISAVSGGSVGTMCFLDRFTPRGPPAAADLDRILAAAGAPSVDAAAWGLAYPDLWRVFFGFLVWPDKTLDRGWALERAWRSHLLHPDATLADWGVGTSAGWLPAAVLNATATETGEQFLLTPLGWDHPWKGRFFSTIYPMRDLHVSTAARLSATFPWVSPMARAQDVNGRPAAPGFHLADGGYFDNFGVVTVVNWLRSLPPEQWEELRRKGLLLVLVRAFPDRPESAGPRAHQSQGWLWSGLGPLLTMYNVRTSAQASTGDVEMELAQKVLACNGVNNLQVVFQLQRNSPLSWKLTEEEKKAILAEWDEEPNRKSLEAARKLFRP
ncbi:MAG TPA: patatin-like phospholipase family protein, partial [Thermoanaerobaculia bacterium]